MGVSIRQIAKAAGVSKRAADRPGEDGRRTNAEAAGKMRKTTGETRSQSEGQGRELLVEKDKIRIGVILPVCDAPLMKEVRKGIEQAAGEVETMGGVVLLYTVSPGSVRETIGAMEEMKAKGVRAIAMVPVEDEEIRVQINLFSEEYEIPIVTFHCDIGGTKRLCFVGQNAVQCGKAAAGLLGDTIGGRGKAAVISGYSTDGVQNNQVLGFCKEMRRRFPGVCILDTEYCFADDTVAEKVTQKILQMHPDLAGIYINSEGQRGVCAAIKARRRAGRIKVVANGFTEENYKLLKDGSINLLLGQDAFVQGYEPVMILFRLLCQGEQPKRELQYTEILIRNVYTIPEEEK